MEKYDERQIWIRGKIMTSTFVITIVVLFVSAFMQDFGIYDFEKGIGFSSFMICLACLLMTYASCAAIWKDAYVHTLNVPVFHKLLYIFTVLAILEIILFTLDVFRGEGIYPVSVMSIFMVTLISISLWAKKKSWEE